MGEIVTSLHGQEIGLDAQRSLVVRSGTIRTQSGSPVVFPDGIEVGVDTQEGVFRVGDYVSFTGSADVTSGVNSAFATARTWLQAGNYRSARVIFPAGARGTVTSTINATGFTNSSNFLIVEGNGAGLLASTAGTPVIDAYGSIGITWNDLNISGQSGSRPSYGVIIGRVGPTASNGGGSAMRFFRCRITDEFTGAPLYNFSGESCTFEDCNFSNTYASASAYAAILDGINAFSVTSANAASTAPANTPQSFNQNLFRRCTFYVAGSSESAAIWRSATRQHEFQNCYIVNAAGTHAILEYCKSGTDGVSEGLKADIHVEDGSLTGYFLIDGDVAAPVLSGFEINAPYTFPTGSMFTIKSGSTVTTATLQNCEIRITGNAATGSASTFKVFADASKWTASGFAILSRARFWNSPATDRVVVQAATLAPTSMLGPVDLLGSAAWAFSASRRLNQNYTGPIIRLRNGTTSGLADFYAGPDGRIDLSTVSAFLAGATGYVHTIYDQSGNGLNRVQSTAGNQAEYILSVSALGNKPALLFTAGGAQAYVTTSSAAIDNLWNAGGFLSLVLNQIGNPGTTSRIFDKAQWTLRYTGSGASYVFIKGAASTSGEWTPTSAMANGGQILDIQYTADNVANDPTIAISATTQATTDIQPIGAFNSDAANDLYMFNSSALNRAPNAHWTEDVAVKSIPAANTLAAVRRNQASFYGLTVAA